MSVMERFMRPAWSAKMRSRAIFPVSQRMSSGPSLSSMPRRRRRPWPMAACWELLMETEADETR